MLKELISQGFMVFLYPIQVHLCSASEYCASRGKKLKDYDLVSETHFEILNPYLEGDLFKIKNIRACFDVSKDTEAVVDFRVAMSRVEGYRDKGLAFLCTGTALIPKKR